MRLPLQKLTERLQRLAFGANSGLVYHGVHTRRVAFGFRIADPVQRTEYAFGRADEAAQFLQNLSRRLQA